MTNSTHNVFSNIMEGSSIAKKIVPVVGMRCTKNYYSDRRVVTVQEIISPRKITIQDNEVICLDYYGGDYKVLDTLEGGIETFTLRRNGRWVHEGSDLHTGIGLTLDSEAHYIDPHF